MTAIKTIETSSGLVATDAIHRIENVDLGYKNKMTYTVRVYVDLTKPFFTEYSGSTMYMGGDVYQECYQHLTSGGGFTNN